MFLLGQLVDVLLLSEFADFAADDHLLLLTLPPQLALLCLVLPPCRIQLLLVGCYPRRIVVSDAGHFLGMLGS